MNKEGITPVYDKDKMDYILESARTARKGDFEVYNAYRNQINGLYLTPSMYDYAIKELCKILKI